VLEYAVPIAVLSVMWTGLFQGNLSLTLATLLVSTVASPLTIPLTLKLLLGQTVQVDVAGMMINMLVSIALPACAGMAVNDLTRGWGRKVLSPSAAPAARILMLLVLLSNSTEVSSYIYNLTPMLVGVVVFIGVFAATGYVWGIVFARLTHQSRGNLVSMTYLCGMRNISAGAVIAASYFPGEAMFPVVMGTLFQQVLAALFSEVTKRIAGVPEPSGVHDALESASQASR
jgi:predicted Na+-dependent transporter